jgi:hypothetical protein
MKGCIGNPSWWDMIPEEYVIDRNYHCIWQYNSGMRFILKEVKGDKVFLMTRGTRRAFWTNLSDLRDTTNNRKNQRWEKDRVKEANKREAKHILSNRMSEMEADIMWK